jgi:hypothetical protein
MSFLHANKIYSKLNHVFHLMNRHYSACHLVLNDGKGTIVLKVDNGPCCTHCQDLVA